VGRAADCRLPQEGILSYPNGEALLEEALRLGADVVGAIPHFEFTREYGVESLHIAFRLAKKYQRPLDIHCDEIDDEQSRFVETVAALALKEGIGPQVTASHTTAMHSYNGAYTSRLFRLLKLSGINFVANPLVNIHLQGRFDDYPKRRGITRVKELMAAGINVCFGHDDVFDPWYPLGTGNMLQVLHMGLHVCQMMGYQQINEGLKLVTENSARTFGLSDYGIATGNTANLVILPAENGFEAVRCQVPVRWSIRQGESSPPRSWRKPGYRWIGAGRSCSLPEIAPLPEQRGLRLSAIPLPRCSDGGGRRSRGSDTSQTPRHRGR
jgi:cytosine deaminase